MAKRGTTTQQGYGHRWRKVRARILTRDRWRCRYCGGRADTVHHLVELAEGGARYDPRNLAAVCRSCNLREARLHEQHTGQRKAWQQQRPRGPRRVWTEAVTLDD